MPLVLTKRGRVYYLRGTVRGRRIFETTGTSDRDAAEAIRVLRESRLLNDSIFGEKASATFLEAAVSYVAGGGSPRFLGTEHSGIAGRFGGRKLHTLTQADLDEAARVLYPAAQPETLNRQVYTPFIAVWNHAVGNGWADLRKWARPRKLKGTAVRHLTKVRSGTKPTDYVTAARFVAAMSPAPAMVMASLFYTGMRPIELFALEAADVDVNARWLVVRSSKTGEPRGVPLHDFLAGWWPALLAQGGRVFRTGRGEPYPMTDSGGGQIKRAVTGARRRSGIADVSPYTARHTVSTGLVIAGVHPHIKDQILGHAVDDMSRHYTSVPQATLIEAINKLPVPAEWRALPWLEDPMKWRGRLVDGTGARNDLRRGGEILVQARPTSRRNLPIVRLTYCGIRGIVVLPRRIEFRVSQGNCYRPMACKTDGASFVAL